jgi:hypothetical protein
LYFEILEEGESLRGIPTLVIFPDGEDESMEAWRLQREFLLVHLGE